VTKALVPYSWSRVRRFRAPMGGARRAGAEADVIALPYRSADEIAVEEAKGSSPDGAAGIAEMDGSRRTSAIEGDAERQDDARAAKTAAKLST
jgi:hypothetical protein